MNFVRSGYYLWSDGHSTGTGTDGDYWTTTTSNSMNAHYLTFFTSRYDPRNDNPKGHGFSVRMRCKNKPSSSTSPSVIVENAPLNFVRGGNFDTTNYNSGGTGGLYWSSTIASTIYSRDFWFNSGLFYPQDNSNKGDHGFSVC